MSEQKEVPLLTADMATTASSALLFAPHWRATDDEVVCLNAIATGDAATYNTHTHVVVERGEIEALRRDAARYRYAQNHLFVGETGWGERESWNDSEIDAAIAVETSKKAAPEQRCRECGESDCNGECYGDDMMGDS